MAPSQRADDLIRRCQQIATTIYPLADHPGLRWSGGTVSGETAAVAAELKALNKHLWSRFDELRHWCDKISDAVGTSEDKVEALLATRVKLDPAGLPVRHGTRKVTSDIGLVALADQLMTEAEQLVAAANQFDTACGRVADQVAEVTSLLSRVEQDASDNGMSDNHDLVVLRDQVRPAVDALLNDPLGQSTHALESTRAGLESFAASIDRLKRLSTDHTEHLAGLRGMLTELVESEREATEACNLAAAKIGNPSPPRLHPKADDLAGRIAAAEQLATEHSWHVLLQQLDQLNTEIGQALRDSRDRVRSSQALLDRRSELRGRFAAYTRKAARLHVVETPHVERALLVAKHLLQVAPCDLPAATVALSTFQDAITAASTKETLR